MRVHVAVDARLWHAYWTGTASYLRGITRALLRGGGDLRYTLLLPGEDPPGLPQGDVPCHVVALDGPHVMDTVWEQVTLPTEVGARGAEVLFAPGGTVPLARDFAVVPVVHDLGFLHHPEFYEEPLRRYLSKWVRLACLTAEAVVCNSEFTRRSVTGQYDVPAGRCHVVYPATDEAFRPEGQERERIRVAEQYGLGRPYVMTVSSGGLNKNLSGLLDGMTEAWQDRHLAEYRLLVVGRRRAVQEAVQAAARPVPGEKVVSCERVSTEDLAALYRGAALFVFPSLYEGFGLPPVEAMACGTAVIASDRGALPEVLGDAAYLCDPADPTALGGAIAEVLSDDRLRDRLARAGRERAGRYCWENSAELLIELFHEVASRS